MEKKDKVTEKLFLLLIDENRGTISKFCYLYSDSIMLFDDLYQEVIYNLWKSYPKFQGNSKESTWVYRITINTCISFLRKKYKRPKYDILNINTTLSIPTEDSSEYFENLKEVYNLINKLHSIDKTLILLWLDGKSYKEISEILIMSVSNVASRLNRVKSKLEKTFNS